MTNLKKEVYVIQVQFKNHNNEDVIQFIGSYKDNPVEFADAKVYKSYKSAMDVITKLEKNGWSNVELRSFTLSI